MKARPPLEFVSDWQKRVARNTGVNPKNAYESFIDVDGEFLMERLTQLVNVALANNLPILFQ
jgi:hypothetical protein